MEEKIRMTSSSATVMVVLFGMVAILVPMVAAETLKSNASAPASTSGNNTANNWDDDDYVPYQGERFDVFDWGLCRNLAKKYTGNMLISPISIKLTLALLYEGAQGQTAHELAGALELPGGRAATRDRFSSVLRSLQASRPEYSFDISTRLVVDQSIKPRQRYGAILKTFYSTDVVIANLTDSHNTAKDINSWVSNVTHGHIKDLITDEASLKDSVLLVINALYFMGSWRYPFSPSLTRNGVFYTDIDKTIQVPYMNNVGHYYYSESPELDAQILRLPYRGQKFAMFIVLPRARTGLQQLTQDINPFVLRRQLWLMDYIPVDLIIPKFKFDYTSHLEGVLREMGIRDIFDNTASLPGIARAKEMAQRLVVSDFVQKAGLQVDEVGTVAYAATEVQIGNKISDRTFHVRHPFLFFIEDETTGTVVFVGKVTNPLLTTGSNVEVSFPSRFGEDTSGSPPAAPTFAAPSQAVEVDDRFNFFDIELLQSLTEDSVDNIIISPASVKAALTALIEGTGGRTRTEILSLLRLPSDPTSLRSAAKRSLASFKATREAGVELNLATCLWTGNDIGINQRYSELLRQNYDSDIQTVNFADAPSSANLINEWVRKQTRGNIQSIVDPGSLGGGTRLLLTNALYMKGNWKTSFDRSLTAKRCFRVPNIGCRNVHLMESLAYYPYAYIPSLDADVVQVPYADDKLSMLFLLPDKEDGINGLSRDLSHTPLSLIMQSLKYTEVLLSVPRFTIESKMDLRPALENLGLRDLFDLNANLSGIISSPVKIGNVLHNAKIEVNEEGTIAAAVTGVAVIPLMGSTVQRFRADRPFIFLLWDSESGSVLFAGCMTNPNPSDDAASSPVSAQRNADIPPRRLLYVSE
ncbi:uncharacterized protein LOC105690599 [Athalia rosae]|uniref:uncharacterized protein LOC105690599 n=1 Tax=Athalia rosae TaxID=37344 RepID=UPI00203346A2|nr:uncharacterized protein LOC105690599 [Athalia rosae]